MTGMQPARPRLVASLAAASVLLVGFLAWVRLGPLPPDLLDLERHASTVVVDRGGVVLYEALSEEGTRSRRLSADDLPETLAEATLAAEDHRFYRHPGVDGLAMVRAAWHDLRAGGLVEGGSTITQQTVKLLTRRPRTVAGKLREVLLALRLEHRLSKRRILALYLNLAPYGRQYVGAEAASRGYFGTSARNLTPAQAAFLAGLPQRPTAFDPYTHFDRVSARQQWVLGRMADAGFLTPSALVRARAERLRLLRPSRDFLAPHFVEHVLAEVGRGGAPRRVETTLDAALQATVEGILERHRERLAAHGAGQVAVAVLDNATGGWLAWEGSGGYFDGRSGGTIDGVVTPRQPGSALKPFTYALAFERGATPATVLPDVPSHFPTAVRGVLYSPRNYDGLFRGPMRARLALAGSENVPAVWMLARVGVADLLALLRRAGLTTLDKNADYYGYGLTMGDAEVRLDELTAAYAALARGGVYREPRSVRRVLWTDGRWTEPRPARIGRILSPRTAYWIADILSDPRARAWAFGTGGSLDFPFPVAAKTGTSQAYRDNWTFGFTREVTVGVWVGNFDRSELQRSSGVTGAAPILHDVLMAAERHVLGRLPGDDAGLVPRPASLVPRSICALSGMAAGEFCPAVETEYLPPDRKLRTCSWHRQQGGSAAVAWPGLYRAWAAEQGLLTPAAGLASAPAPLRGTEPSESRGPRIVNPPEGARYLRDPTLRPAFQTLPLRAVAEGSRRLTWIVDGREVGRAAPEGSVDWPLGVGPHTIAVVDDRGRRSEARILVR